MDKFCRFYKVLKDKETEFASLNIENVILDSIKLEEYLCEYLLQKENLAFIFCEPITNQRNYQLMLRRFLPREPPTNIDEFVLTELNKNKAFYSFLAEAILPLVYRDIYGYQLASAAIDIKQTLTDTSTGADACMFDEKGIFVLGEAKFYKSLKLGLDEIIANFKEKKGFINKLDNLNRNFSNNSQTNSLIIRQLGKDAAREYEFQEFLKLPIYFSGFVLHELGERKFEDFKSDIFYDSYDINASSILANLKREYSNIKNVNFHISMFHFPINSKEKLISKTIAKCYELKKIGG